MTVVEDKEIQHTHNCSSQRRKPIYWHKENIEKYDFEEDFLKVKKFEYLH